MGRDVPEKSDGVNVRAGHGSPARTGSADASGLGSSEPVFVYATFPDVAHAEKISGELVGLGLAACVNLFPGMRSIYRWQGAIEKSEEVAAFVKTRAGLVARIVGVLRVLHPFVNPAVVVLPLGGGSPDFLAWIRSETAGHAEARDA